MAAASDKVKLIFCLGALISGSFLLLLFISRTSTFVDYQMNADNLLAVSFIWDLQHQDHALQGFQLPRIPSILPDLLIQAVAVLVSPTYAWSLFVYSWIQLVMFALAVAWLASLLSGRPIHETAMASGMVIALTVLADTWLPGTTAMSYNYFFACLHFGPFVVSLLASAIAFKLLLNWRHSAAGGLFLVSTLAILSNKLLLVAFAFPLVAAAVATAALRPICKTHVLRLAGVVAGSALMAYLLDKGINRQPDLALEWGWALVRLQLFVADSLAFARGHAWVVAACVLVPLGVFSAYAVFILREECTQPRESGLARLFFWLQGACAIASVTVAVGLLAYADYGSYRYLVPVLTWPLVFMAAAAVSHDLGRKAVYAAGIGIVALCAADIGRRGDMTPGTVSWRSPIADCILANKERFDLRSGIAEYWISRPVMFGSGWTLQVHQAGKDGRPFIWGNNRLWYIKPFDGQAGPPEYNFVVMEGMDPAAVTSRFGQPSQSIKCPTGQEIFVYDDHKRMTRQFLEILTPPDGDYLQSCVDAMQIGPRIIAKCRTLDGAWRWSRLNTRRCADRGVRNSDGRLAC